MFSHPKDLQWEISNLASILNMSIGMAFGESDAWTHQTAVSSSNRQLREHAFIDATPVLLVSGHLVRPPNCRPTFLSVVSDSQSDAKAMLLAQWYQLGPHFEH